MATLERVMQMNEQGYTESQIINTLKQEGVSPKEIYDALSQSKIKSVVSQKPEEQYENEDMQPSISEENQEYLPEAAPATYSEEVSYEQPQPQEYYTPYQGYQPPTQATDIETINEIAEQIADEKTSELKKQIDSFKNISEEMKSEVERINKKIEKLENNFSDLQIAILKRIGDYGENIKNIANEMHETQNSFSKILNPLTDNLRELQKIAGTEPKKSEKVKTEDKSEEKRQKKSNFEEFIR